MSTDRADLIGQLDLAGREVSTATVLFHSVLAARRGLSATEEKALDILLRSGPLTHAELADRLALARPTVSDLLDRLEARGLATRAAHPDDRRRVLVSAEEERIAAELTPLFAPWVDTLHALYQDYSDEQLAVIADFLRRAAAAQLEATDRLAAD